MIKINDHIQFRRAEINEPYRFGQLVAFEKFAAIKLPSGKYAALDDRGNWAPEQTEITEYNVFEIAGAHVLSGFRNGANGYGGVLVAIPTTRS